MRAPLLRRVAEETGGRFYPLADVARLSEDVRYSGSGITRVESYDLWDMPIVFLLIVGLVGGRSAPLDMRLVLSKRLRSLERVSPERAWEFVAGGVVFLGLSGLLWYVVLAR